MDARQLTSGKEGRCDLLSGRSLSCAKQRLEQSKLVFSLAMDMDFEEQLQGFGQPT